ncbi:hypothetical protein P5G51_016885 [Virgibacillus sp. 179-BFC.A HS]|uniref:Uncharacterized protein n=1 Tax=Tigheibacillus jepli TaxID=3035914 RepID=A0ABU5CMY6_9BACI|nr:hypothetical protein [Virgibacillus sp. 179-BFC.A HS]MDY0406808.1 hypothetical protein [Virgibacillus sp. 179-BFC.A HS]
MSTDLNYSIPKLQLNMTDLLMAPFGESEIVEAYRQKYGNRPDVAMYSSIKTAAKNFRVIDSPTTSVIVPYEKGEDIIAELMGDTTVDDLTKLFREAQQYTVNIYEHEKKQLTENDGLVSVFDGEILVAKKGAYAEEYGLEPNNNSGLEYLQY